MTARIDVLFARLRAEERAAFVAYVMAGDPDRDASLATLHALAEAGADMIELGFPFSDPMAEGVPIQRAAQRSLKAGTTLAGTLELARAFRATASTSLSSFAGEVSTGHRPGDGGVIAGTSGKAAGLDLGSPPAAPSAQRSPSIAGGQSREIEGAGGPDGTRLAAAAELDVRNAPQLSEGVARQGSSVNDTPLILMGYLNPIESYGLDRFARDASLAGIDGLIVVDCPPEEADPLADALDEHGIALIRLATPTTDDARLPTVLRRTSGFVYYVSVAGVTGQKAADADAVAPAVKRIRDASGLPVAVGFGIRTPEQAAAVARIADAAVVGSALVDEVALAVAAGEPPAPRVGRLAGELARAVRSARTPADG